MAEACQRSVLVLVLGHVVALAAALAAGCGGSSAPSRAD
jgi:hypothetical protein